MEVIDIISAFRDISIKEILDILLVTLFIYLLLIFVKETRSRLVFNTIIVISLVIYIAGLFDLALTRTLFQPFLTFFLVILVIVFQREIRRFFEWFSLSGNLFRRSHIVLSEKIFNELRIAVQTFIKNKIGAIIVISGKHPLDHAMLSGVPLGGYLSSPLLISIFDTRTPGHDGAVIIKDNKVTHFGVHLPLAQNYGNVNSTGTRHRAAMGVTEETDALAIVISEERGTVSICENGRLQVVSKEQFEERVQDFIHEQSRSYARDIKKFAKELITENWLEKLSSVALAILLWLVLIAL